MARPIFISSFAKSDLRRIEMTIRSRVSPASARKWRLKIEKAVADLASSAEMHPEAEEATLLGLPIRMRLVGRRPHVYRILFTYTSKRVVVHRIRHAAQDYLTEDDL